MTLMLDERPTRVARVFQQPETTVMDLVKTKHRQRDLRIEFEALLENEVLSQDFRNKLIGYLFAMCENAHTMGVLEERDRHELDD